MPAGRPEWRNNEISHLHGFWSFDRSDLSRASIWQRKLHVLFRQDKRVRLLRYAGEGHTISDRANVLDFWQRIEAWLKETMAPRKAQ
jgi:hypothetical protein